MDRAATMSPAELSSSFREFLVGRALAEADSTLAASLADPAIALWCWMRDDGQLEPNCGCLASATSYLQPGFLERFQRARDIPNHLREAIRHAFAAGFPHDSLPESAREKWDQELHAKHFAPFALSLASDA
jgi:hypothetical protein